MRVLPLAALWLCSSALWGAGPLPPALFDQLQWRMIGPFRGGRVAAVAGVAGDGATFYFGSVGGGVWKTTNAGTTWRPIFDGQPVASIGAIAVAPSNPDILYVGTGETDIRSQFGFGDGVYRSADAGRTWRNIGLKDTRQIARIIVDPRDPNRLYVAALGHVYGPHPERGVFRSTDGGGTWQKVLYSNPEVGAVDLSWDPANTKIIYAMLWNGHRPPWSQYGPIEGPGSGLWRSVDGGDHWTQIRGHGLPETDWRRSGVAVCPGGKRIYALVDAQGGGLFRSDDGGESWTRFSTEPGLTSRSWFFGGITVDPHNPDHVYVPNVALHRSTDGGKTFTILKGAPGGDDYRILWIDPTDSRRMILGSDQGTNISVDNGAHWSSWYNQPTAQMYHVITDNRFPYAVYGTQQDSGTAAVMSRTDHGAIDARDWFSVGGAESGYIAIDPANQDILYVGNTNGSLSRFDRRTGQAQNITPWPMRSGGLQASIATQKHRYPWTPPLVFSAADRALYYGSQYVMKTTDGGLTWKEISPDLTGDTRTDRTQAVGTPSPANARALGYGVVYAIGPSPLEAGTIWAGSDTGLVHVTRNGGGKWDNVTPPGVADWSRVTQIEASHFDAGTAYVSVDRHRMEDYKPYIYRTPDYGKSWTPISEGLKEPAYVNGIREDPKRRGLLYGATELGVAVSFDDGDHWQALQLNLPVVSVRDLVIHDDDLVIGTHGRGFWILDNMSLLRQLDERSAATEAILYKPAVAIRFNAEGFMGTPFPVEEPKARNPMDGAVIDYYLRSAPAGEVTLEILDSGGKVVRRYSSRDAGGGGRRPQNVAAVWIVEPARLGTRAGMNRFAWDLRHASPAGDTAAETDFGPSTAGPQVAPGTYQVRLSAGGRSYTQPLEVKLDPRSSATAEDLRKQTELTLDCAREIGRAAEAIREIRAFRRQLAERKQSAAGDAAARIDAMDAEAQRIAGAATGGGRGGRGGGGAGGNNLASVNAQLTTAMSVAGSQDRTPPESAYTIYRQATQELTALLASWQKLKAGAPR